MECFSGDLSSFKSKHHTFWNELSVSTLGRWGIGNLYSSMLPSTYDGGGWDPPRPCDIHSVFKQTACTYDIHSVFKHSTCTHGWVFLSTYGGVYWLIEQTEKYELKFL